MAMPQVVLFWCVTVGLGMYVGSKVHRPDPEDDEEELDWVDNFRSAAGSAGFCLAVLATAAQVNAILRDIHKSSQNDEDQ